MRELKLKYGKMLSKSEAWQARLSSFYLQNAQFILISFVIWLLTWWARGFKAFLLTVEHTMFLFLFQARLEPPAQEGDIF